MDRCLKYRASVDNSFTVTFYSHYFLFDLKISHIATFFITHKCKHDLMHR